MFSFRVVIIFPQLSSARTLTGRCSSFLCCTLHFVDPAAMSHSPSRSAHSAAGEESRVDPALDPASLPEGTVLSTSAVEVAVAPVDIAVDPGSVDPEGDRLLTNVKQEVVETQRALDLDLAAAATSVRSVDPGNVQHAYDVQMCIAKLKTAQTSMVRTLSSLHALRRVHGQVLERIEHHYEDPDKADRILKLAAQQLNY